MIELTAFLRLPDPESQARAILVELGKQMTALVRRAIPGIRVRLALLIERAIENSPEYHSLLGGELQAELGVADPVGAMRSIVNGIAGGMQVELRAFRPQGEQLSGGLSIRILRFTLEDALSAASASFQSEGDYRIDWLRWLLTSGTTLINDEYEFVAGGDFAHSRTGLGVMRRGGTWGVPAEFAGTVRDNWLTRALNGVGPLIEPLIAEELNRA